ncbi:beta-galactosidase GanA [Gellertiella hungarica]|uniref:beta-galactosidase n=2 Tax=Gellertiella hungarica TaxID=1572859 RepID=A0A7W6J5W1_9HYPH|nr:beta-galactosidase GanA [Gellertiella hungarica]
MGFVNDFDHWAVGDNLDLASWDSYPIGFVEKFPFTEDERNRWAETSHPDIAPFHHDLYRGVGKGRFWVMEQQPGPVNWAPWNPVPRPGMVRLWTLEAIAHGAEVVSYFRWRQAPFAQEQMHAGLNLPGLDELSAGGREARQSALDLENLGALKPCAPAPVAILYDYENHWSTIIQPQGRDFRAEELAFRWYEAIRRLGLDVDFVRPGADLSDRKLILVPGLMHVSDEALRALKTAKGIILFGPRSGSRDRHFQIPDALPPGPLQDLVPLRVTQVSSLRPGLADAVSGMVSGQAVRWRESIKTTADILSRFSNGDPALIAKDNIHYLGCWPDESLLTNVIAHMVRKAELETVPLPPHVRLRRRGDLVFAFNYGPSPWVCPGEDFVLGGSQLEPCSVAAWREGATPGG